MLKFLVSKGLLLKKLTTDCTKSTREWTKFLIPSLPLIKQDSESRMRLLERIKFKLVARVRDQIQPAEKAAYAPLQKTGIKREAGDGAIAVIEVSRRMKCWWYNKENGSA